MKCPMETRGSAELLGFMEPGQLDAETTALLEQHIEICPACREVVGGQRAVSAALDAWEAPPVSADFDSRLYRRIENDVSSLGLSWWGLSWGGVLIRAFRPMWVRQGVPVAAAAAIMLLAGTFLERPASVEPVAPTESAQLESVQPEQVEQALEAMQMLSDFSHEVRAAANQPGM